MSPNHRGALAHQTFVPVLVLVLVLVLADGRGTRLCSS